MNVLARLLTTIGAALILSSTALADGDASPKAIRQGTWTLAPAKPQGSGIVLRHSVPARLSVGQTATVRLRFERVGADDARVELKVPDGVTITLADGSAATGVSLPRGRESTLELRVTPHSDGVHYLDVFTTQNGRSSAQSVALKVGTAAAAALKRNGAALTTPSGEKVISLPAQR